jgi:hypothetical protein
MGTVTNMMNICSKEATLEKMKLENKNTIDLDMVEPSRQPVVNSTKKLDSLYRRIKSIAMAKVIAKKLIIAQEKKLTEKNITEEEFNAKIDRKVMEKLKTIPQFKLTPQEKHKFLYTYTKCPVELKDGSCYIGNWDTYGKRHGYGKSVLPDGNVYIGLWVRDVIGLRGILVSKNGDYYEGEFENGQANGKGVFIKGNGTKYKGEWKYDIQEGEGEETFSNGSKYIGQFSNGTKTGLGTFIWPDGSSYSGTFFNNSIHGKGLYKWKDNKSYNGEWINNKMHGYGVFYYEDGKRYEGFFNNDKKDDYGTLYWSENKYYLGEWKEGKRNGYGTLYVGNKVKKGIWVDGKLSEEDQVIEDLNDIKLKKEEENPRKNERFYTQFNNKTKKGSEIGKILD